MHCVSADQQEKLLSVKELMEKPVTVTLPWTGEEKVRKHDEQKATRPIRYTKVVIMGVSCEWFDDDIQTYTGADYVRRIKRRENGELTGTSAVVLGYKQDAPSDVRLGYTRFRTRPYVDQPIQCH